MKTWKLMVGVGIFLTVVGATRAAIVVPGANNTDGALNITTDTEIDLSLASTGAWDGNSSGSNGIYDPEKWAVVFKFSSVNIASNVTVTFKNHPAKAPVVWLVSGDVTINGVVSLNGQDSVPSPHNAEGGPGGFRGGMGYYNNISGGNGLGMAGRGVYSSTDGAYGNASLVPLIGGSGGGGDNGGGGGGGGALLLASSSSIELNGVIMSKGGDGYASRYTGGGSGGGIRLLCDTLNGTGALDATGGVSGDRNKSGPGRIRIETVSNHAHTMAVMPGASTDTLTADSAAQIWPAANAPKARIVSVGGNIAPAEPYASFGATGADIAVTQTNMTAIVLETTNVEATAQVKVRITPRHSQSSTLIDASVTATNSLDPLVLEWTATTSVNSGFSAIQARIIRP